MAEKKEIVIALTDRAPVKVRTADWPRIAHAEGDSFRGDYGRYQQSLAQGECDRYWLRVRRHADGRAIVYGSLDAAISAWHAPAGGKDWAGGEMLGARDDVAAAIRRVGADGGLPDSLVRECIASLPAQVLD